MWSCSQCCSAARPFASTWQWTRNSVPFAFQDKPSDQTQKWAKADLDLKPPLRDELIWVLIMFIVQVDCAMISNDGGPLGNAISLVFIIFYGWVWHAHWRSWAPPKDFFDEGIDIREIRWIIFFPTTESSSSCASPTDSGYRVLAIVKNSRTPVVVSVPASRRTPGM